MKKYCECYEVRLPGHQVWALNDMSICVYIYNYIYVYIIWPSSPSPLRNEQVTGTWKTHATSPEVSLLLLPGTCSRAGRTACSCLLVWL